MSPEPVLPAGAPGLNCIKESVRSLQAYTLDAPAAPRKLNQNESPLDLPDTLKAPILARWRDEAWHRYPEFVPDSLTGALARRHGWAPEGVLVGNGSNELIQAVFAVTLGPDRPVVFPAPTFSLYALLAGVLGAPCHAVPMAEGFRYDAEALIGAASRSAARVVLVCSPNNPTGSTLSRAEVARLLDGTTGLVVVDEAYQEFGGETAVPLLRESARLVVLRTFSKAFGLAGLRFGYALAHPELARQIAKAKLPYNVNRLTLAAADFILSRPDALEGRVRELVARREATLARLRRVPGLAVQESAANFFLIRSDRWSAGALFDRLLTQFGILVRDVSAGPGLDGYLRISVGTEEDMDAVVDALTTLHGNHA